MANGSARAHRLAVLAIMLDLITFAVGLGFIFVAIGHDANSSTECFTGNLAGICKTAHDTTGLGMWPNMPSTSTELFGNTTQRGLLLSTSAGGVAFSGLSAQLQIGCITQSNTIGANLQLQYAIFSSATNTILTGFQNIGGIVNIDGTTAPDCASGTWATSTSGLLNTTASQQGYIFRVMGSGGGGSGDNPIFSLISTIITESVRRVNSVILGTPTVTTFAFQAQSVFPVAVATAITIQWQATNITTTACGFISDHCWESGSASATIAAGGTASPTTTVTFSTAFTGTVHVTATATGAGTTTVVPVAVVNLLQTQTVTV